MKYPKVIILKTAGTNCDKETAFAFRSLAAEVDVIHINEFKKEPESLLSYKILCIPGGFSYGDDISAGRVLGLELNLFLRDAINAFIESGGLVIGICNGFQVLVNAGLLPGLGENMPVSLIENRTGSFIDRWCVLEVPESKCVWTKYLQGREVNMPIAHAEGRFIAEDSTIEILKKNGQIAFYYQNNPNGSVDSIAGICDSTGRILGMMPHPERASFLYQFPDKAPHFEAGKAMPAMEVFKAGIEAVQSSFV